VRVRFDLRPHRAHRGADRRHDLVPRRELLPLGGRGDRARQEGLSPEYRIVLDDGPRGLPVVTIQVEGEERVHARVRESLRGGLGVNPELEVLPVGTLPRAEQSKAKRVLDRRSQTT
jgi:hypothetical protein